MKPAAEATFATIAELGVPSAGQRKLVGVGPLGPVYRGADQARKRLLHVDDAMAARIGGDLSRLPAHPNVASVELVHRDGGWTALVPWAPATAALATAAELQTLAEAVEALHAAGVVHGHLSPPNLRVGSQGELWVMDTALWGPPVVGPRAGAWQRSASPDRLAGEPATTSDDCWALGALLARFDPDEGVAGSKAIADALRHVDPGERMTASQAVAALAACPRPAQSAEAERRFARRLSSQPPPDAVGDRFGPYRVVRTLGRGGMGVVHLAVDDADGRAVALKTVTQVDPTLRWALRRECRCLQALRHRGVARLLAHGVREATPWYAMELVRGESLRRTLASLEHPREALPLFASLCDTLAWLHGEGLVHADLKPDNILVDLEGVPVLIDFGLASRVHRGGTRERLDVRTRIGGSAPYMPPEQATTAPLDPRADLYALGCLIYEAWSGHPPFVAASVNAVLRMHRTATPVPLSQAVDDVPADLDALVQQLLAKDPADRPGYAGDVAERLRALADMTADTPRAPAWVYRPRLAGRRSELEALERWFTCDAPPALVWVTGVSGVGKTRLVVEAARRRLDAGVSVHTVECAAVAVPAPPLAPFAPVLSDVADRIERGDDATALLGPHGAVLAAFEPLLGPAPPASSRLAMRAMKGLAHVLGALQPGPCLVVVGDAHRADELTLRFLEHAAAGGLPDGVGLWVTWRSEEATDPLRALAATCPGVELGPLRAADVASMTADMLASEPPPAAFAEALAAHAEGNPFYIAEYLRAAVRTGALTRAAGRWNLAQVDIDAVALPRAIEQILEERLARLSPSARRVARVAALVGRGVEPQIVGQVAELDEDRVADALQELLTAVVVEEDAHRQLSFTHDKLREVAVATVPQEARAGLHLRAADALEPGDADRAAVARHWELGGALEAAHLGYAEAARARAARSAYRDAQELYDKALGLADPDETLELRIEAISNTTYRFAHRQARTDLEQVLAHATRIGDRRATTRAQGWLVQVLVDVGHVAEAEALLPEALEGYRALGRREYGTMLETAAAVHTRRGRYADAVACHEEALEIFTSEGWDQQRGPALSRLAGDVRHLGDMERSLDLEEQALVLLRAAGDRFYEGVVLSNIGSLKLELDDLDGADGYMRRAAAVHREVDNRRSLGVVLLNRGALALARDRPDEAAGLLDEALVLHREVGSAELEAYASALLARVETARGNPQAVGPLLDRAIAMQRAEGLWADLAFSLRIAARIEREVHHDLDEAHRLITEARRLEVDTGSPLGEAECVCELGQIAVAAGRDASALLAEARLLAADTRGALELHKSIARLEEAITRSE